MKGLKQIHTFIKRCQVYPLSNSYVDWWIDWQELQGIMEWGKKQNSFPPNTNRIFINIKCFQIGASDWTEKRVEFFSSII